MALVSRDAHRVQEIGRAAGTALRVHQLLQGQPIVSIPVAAARLKLSIPAVNMALGHLVKLGVVRELTGKTGGRLFAYAAALKLLHEEMGPGS